MVSMVRSSKKTVLDLVNVEIGACFARGWPRKTWTGVMGRDMEEWKVRNELAKGICFEVIHKNPSNLCMCRKKVLKRI